MTVLQYRSPEDERAVRADSGNFRNWLGWSIFLAMSWTWCIGMFLPVLLVRDYGGLAWLVFAVPNVLGAAAMGWVLKDGTGAVLTSSHRPALVAFSIITCAFQLFFAWWIFSNTRNQAFIIGTLVCAAIVYLPGVRRERSTVELAVLVLLFSIAVLVIQIVAEDLRFPSARDMLSTSNPSAILALAPASLFGFLLCPYLDNTFHFARESMRGSAARKAFSIGFAFFFLGIIVFTLGYAKPMIFWMEDLRATEWWPSGALQSYWMIQLALTVGLHWRASSYPETPQPLSIIVVVLSIGIALLAISATRLLDDDLHPGETIYRLFMSFYGLVFPAYVWLCMIPGRGRAKPNARQLMIFAIAVILAAPAFWMGFIQGKMVWVLPGLAIVLLARFLIRPVAVAVPAT
jgi:hypothetical protein